MPKIMTKVYFDNGMNEIKIGQPVEEYLSLDELADIVDEYRILKSDLTERQKQKFLKTLFN